MVVVRIWEGLGNQMFQYAYARYLKEVGFKKIYLERRRIYKDKLHGEDLSVERKCYLHKFNITIPFINPKYLSGWKYLSRRSLKDKLLFALNNVGIEKYRYITDADDKFSVDKTMPKFDKDTYVMGHFFHRKYIEPIRDILLKEFTLKKQLGVGTELMDILQSKKTVSVHVRRGDYLYVDCAKTINAEMKRGRYYERAMSYMTEHIDNLIFLFFSDDIDWVKKNFAETDRSYFVSGNGYSDYEEIILMSMCSHNIIANSTFSFWGAWLNTNLQKTVIVPKHWMPSVVPKEWIKF